MFKIKTLYFAILIILLPTIKVYGQQNLTNANIRKYNTYINNAEIAITYSNYILASSYYDTAFNQVQYPFAKDKYNSAVCDALLFKYVACKAKLTYLLYNGMEFKYIEDNIAFQDFLHTKTGRNIKKMPVKIFYNENIRYSYDSILIKDQYFRELDPQDYMKKYGDTVCKIDASNVLFMNNLIEKYGWPSEKLIGITMNSSLYEIIIIHQCDGSPCRVYNYTEEIKNAYNKGQIEAQKAAYLIMRSSGIDDMGEMSIGIITFVFDSIGNFKYDNIDDYPHKSGFIKLNETTRKNIDSKRFDFGLESIEDFQRKVFYNLTDKRFIFSSYSSHSIFPIEDKSSYEIKINKIVSL